MDQLVHFGQVGPFWTSWFILDQLVQLFQLHFIIHTVPSIYKPGWALKISFFLWTRDSFWQEDTNYFCTFLRCLDFLRFLGFLRFFFGFLRFLGFFGYLIFLGLRKVPLLTVRWRHCHSKFHFWLFDGATVANSSSFEC